MLKRRLSEETKRRISESKKGHKHSLETRQKMSKARMGNPGYWLGKKRPFPSEQWRKKKSESMKGTKLMLGKHHSEATKRKIGLAHRGNKWGLGKVRSLETRLKTSGSNNWNWKGGITTEIRKIRSSLEMQNWRKAVFQRDDYTCQICGQKGGLLHADHIKRFALFPELRFEVSNGRTLCYNCHRKTDNYGGKGLKRIK